MNQNRIIAMSLDRFGWDPNQGIISIHTDMMHYNITEIASIVVQGKYDNIQFHKFGMIVEQDGTHTYIFNAGRNTKKEKAHIKLWVKCVKL